MKAMNDHWHGVLGRRDMKEMKNLIHYLSVQSGPKLLKENTACWQSDLEQATDVYWQWNVFRLSWELMVMSNDLTKGGPLANELPVVVAVGDQAPDLLLLDGALRIKKQL